MTLRRYRLIDLGLFAALLCLLEAACAYALGLFTGEAYTLSVTLFIALLVMMRWGWPGVILGVLGGLCYCLVHGGTGINYAVYGAGALALSGNLLWFRWPGAEKLRGSPGYAALYCVSGYAALCLGRTLAALAVDGAAFLPTLIRFFSVDALSGIFTVVFILIARKQNGLFEPQVEYLKRLHEAEEERRRGA